MQYSSHGEPMTPMDDNDFGIEPLLEKYLAILNIRRKVIFIFASVLVVTAVIATLFAEKVYASRAVIEVMPVAPKIMEMEEVETLGARTGSKDFVRLYYGTQHRIVKSNTVIGKVLERIRTDHGVTSFDEAEDPVEKLRSKMRLIMHSETTLFVIRVEDSDPELAALIANTIAEVYMENNLERGQAATKQALNWLEKELKRYRQQKLAADERVHEYKFENDLVGIEEQHNSVLDQMRLVHDLHNKTQTELVTLTVERDQFQNALGAGLWRVLSSQEMESSPNLTSYLDKEADLQKQLNKMLVYYLPSHPEVIELQSEIDGLRALVKEELTASLAQKETALIHLEEKKSALEVEMVRIKDQIKNFDRKMIELEFLTAEATRNETIFNDLDSRLSQVDLSQFMSANNIRFVDRAEPDFEEVSPNIIQNVVLSIVLGLLGGAALAFLLEFLDNSIKSTEDLEKMLGMPLLGVVPIIDPEDMALIPSNRERAIYSFTRQRSPVAESLRSIRTNIKFRTGNKEQLLLLVTSAVPKEGKSFTASNLSAVMAMSGQRVLLIDADLRRPSIHRLFEMTDDFGTVDLLTGGKTITELVQPSHVPNLDIIVAGPTPENPNELLGNGVLRNIKALASEYDIIVIDSPPATAVSDPMVLSPLVDGVVLVVEANQTRRPVVQQAINRLKNVNANLLGGVVNKFDSTRSGYGYYYYYADYGYYAEDDVDAQKIG
jgi:polysaccharide biosynthesis transport protein